MKKILKISIYLVLASLLFVSCKKKGKAADSSAGDPLKVVFMVNGNLGDLSFYDSANRGMTLLKEKYGDKIKTKTVEASMDDTKWVPTLEDLSEQDWDVIIVGTFTMVEMLQEIAAKYPNKKYILFDGLVDYSGGKNKNVYSILYKQNEASFLAGALVAKITVSGDDRTNPDKKIGFLGGLDIPVINDFMVGYIQGAKYVLPDVKVLFSYVGSFDDSARGKEIALVQYNQGVDIAFNVAGTAGLGQIDAAKDMNKYAIGVDSDQAMLFEETSPEKAEHIITSVLKRIDNSLVRAIEKHLDGSLAYGSFESLGFQENAVGLAENKYYKANTSVETRDFIEKLKAKISSGEIKVDSAFGMSQDKLKEIKDSVR